MSKNTQGKDGTTFESWFCLLTAWTVLLVTRAPACFAPKNRRRKCIKSGRHFSLMHANVSIKRFGRVHFIGYSFSTSIGVVMTCGPSPTLVLMIYLSAPGCGVNASFLNSSSLIVASRYAEKYLRNTRRAHVSNRHAISNAETKTKRDTRRR